MKKINNRLITENWMVGTIEEKKYIFYSYRFENVELI